LKSLHWEIVMTFRKDKEGIMSVKKTTWRPWADLSGHTASSTRIFEAVQLLIWDEGHVICSFVASHDHLLPEFEHTTVGRWPLAFHLPVRLQQHPVLCSDKELPRTWLLDCVNRAEECTLLSQNIVKTCKGCRV
jgi:hypothetical protein